MMGWIHRIYMHVNLRFNHTMKLYRKRTRFQSMVFAKPCQTVAKEDKYLTRSWHARMLDFFLSFSRSHRHNFFSSHLFPNTCSLHQKDRTSYPGATDSRTLLQDWTHSWGYRNSGCQPSHLHTSRCRYQNISYSYSYLCIIQIKKQVCVYKNS